MKACYLLVLLAVLLAAAGVSAEEKTTVTADSVRSVKSDGARETQLTGATFMRNGIQLFADQMVMRSQDKQHVITATGSPRLQDAVSLITGDSITIDTASGQAQAAGHAVLEMMTKVPEGKTEAVRLTFSADNISYDYVTHNVRLTGHVTLKLPDMACSFDDAIVEYDWQESKLTVTAPIEK